MNSAQFLTKYIKTDEAYTTRAESDKLVDYLIQNRIINNDMVIWLPFDNELSNLYKSLNHHHIKVTLSNLEMGLDFYLYEPKHWDMIITNPPFSNRSQMMNRLLSFDKPFIVLQPTQYFQNQFAVISLCKYSNEFQFLLPRTRMNFLRYDKKSDLIKSSKGGPAFYSFWLCYKVGLSNAFVHLADNGKEKVPESYEISGNAIIDTHLNLFNVEVTS